MACVYLFVRDVYEGFFIENHNTEPSREIYEKRTYAYNYWEHILRISAIASGAGKDRIEAISGFGKYVGMAYMVTNDIADIIKEFEDIKNGRYTLPNILFCEKADDHEKELFRGVFGNNAANADELKIIGQIMVDKGIVGECQAHASKLVGLALPHLGIFDDSRPKRLLAVATRAVYNNQWYRSMTDLYGYRRTVVPCGLELAGIKTGY